jgi:hypothetical protein
MSPLIHVSKATLVFLGVLACLLSPQAGAVCQQGCDLINDNTFLGDDALLNNTTGFSNTATGRRALYRNTIGLDNTAVGDRAMQSNIDGSRHTAVGSHALFNCVAAPDFAGNTAVGTSALFSDTTGNFNTAIGDSALFSNTTGSGNIALGADAGSLIDGDNSRTHLPAPPTTGR